MTNEEAAAMLESMKNYFLPTSPMLEERREITALDLAISALSKQCASTEQDDHIADNSKMVKLQKRTIIERLIIAQSLIEGVIFDSSNQFRDSTKKTDSERVSLPKQEKSKSFSEKPSESNDSEMNCSDVPDINVGKTDFKPETVTNCHDLISKRDAYLALVEKGQASRRYKLGETWKLNGKEIREALDALPSAQPERKRGRWLPDNRPGGGFWVCSECKFPSEAFAADVLYKFCPNCGAEMREGE